MFLRKNNTNRLLFFTLIFCATFVQHCEEPENRDDTEEPYYANTLSTQSVGSGNTGAVEDYFYNFEGDGFDAYVLKNPKLVSIDGGHPGVKGHQKLAELLQPQFDRILTKHSETNII